MSRADAFSADWLALREPFDAEARDRAADHLQLMSRLSALRPDAGPWRVMDLGCGTGANLRWLAPRLGGAQEWLVVDHDADLLAHWATRPELTARAGGLLRREGPGFSADIVRLQADLARDLDRLPWHAAQLVTASALLDLVGEAWLLRLCERAAAAGTALFFSLNVDGVHAWSPADEDDEPIHDLFAAHQRRDKGLGPALGPDAVPRLEAALRARGYTVFTAPSDWRIGGPAPGDHMGMVRAMVDGIGQAAIEQDLSSNAMVRRWQRRRLRQLAQTGLRVGHLDLLALAPTRR